MPVGNYPPGYRGYAAATDEAGDRRPSTGPIANDIQILTHANGEAAIDLLIAAIASRHRTSMAPATAARC